MFHTTLVSCDQKVANLKIKSPALNYNLIKGGSIGFAECFMRNEFETNNLSDLIELTARNINIVHKFSGLLDLKFLNFIKNKFIKNTKSAHVCYFMCITLI